MFEVNAVFSRKESDFETQSCVVEKVIRLSGPEYDRFAGNMLREQDFIKDNADKMYRDSTGKLHGLLVVGEGRSDGIFIDSAGYDYARYTAFLPGAGDALPAMRYPALAELNRKLSELADIIAEQAGAGSPDGRGVVNLQHWGAYFDIDLMANRALRNTLLDMLRERPEVKNFELDQNELVLYRRQNTAERTAGAEKASVKARIEQARKNPAAKEKKPDTHKKDKGGVER